MRLNGQTSQLWCVQIERRPFEVVRNFIELVEVLTSDGLTQLLLDAVQGVAEHPNQTIKQLWLSLKMEIHGLPVGLVG